MSEMKELVFYCIDGCAGCGSGLFNGEDQGC